MAQEKATRLVRSRRKRKKRSKGTNVLKKATGSTRRSY